MDTRRVESPAPTFLLSRTPGKFPALKSGEVIRAQVVDVLPDGHVSLRIKGNLIEAKSDVRLPQGAAVLFRVLGQKTGEGGVEIHLQLMELAADPTSGLMQESTTGQTLSLARELAANLLVKDRTPGDLATTVEELLKSLPDNASVLPKEVRQQLQNLLQASLRSAGQSIGDRLNSLFSDPLLQESPEWTELVNLKDSLFADMDGVSQVPLRSLLGNTGVALEARLATLAEMITAQPDMSSGRPPQTSLTMQSHETAHLKTDLKARLLQIKQRILDLEKPASHDAVSSQLKDLNPAGEKSAAAERMLQIADGLLRDIETFQLLSKLTTSFYTFLPVIWKGLREAEIAFKRSSSSPQGKSHYCLMNLDFERLGKLTIVAMMQGRDLFVSFKTDHPELRTVLNKNIHELGQMFQAQGFNLKAVNFVGKDEEHLAPFERLESFEHFVNIKI